MIVVGRLRNRSWETEGADRRISVEVEVVDVGPSLRWATARVTRQRHGDA